MSPMVSTAIGAKYFEISDTTGGTDYLKATLIILIGFGGNENDIADKMSRILQFSLLWSILKKRGPTTRCRTRIRLSLDRARKGVRDRIGVLGNVQLSAVGCLDRFGEILCPPEGRGMSRQPRADEAGGSYHGLNRGNARAQFSSRRRTTKRLRASSSRVWGSSQLI